jgi:RNA polymerase subunit RPABC4/transcription elongation factor Spt4
MSGNSFKDPEVTAFVECPNCGRLLEYESEACLTCREEIVEDYAYLSAATVLVNTQGVSLANTISSGDPAAVIMFFISSYVYLFDLYDTELPVYWAWLVLGVGTAIPLLATLTWFVKFNWFSKIGDDEFVETKREMCKSLGLWVALFMAQLIAFATLWL